MVLVMKRISRAVNYIAALMCGLLLFGVAIFVCADVLMGFLFRSHIVGAIEIIVLTIPWIVCMGFAFALIQGTHVRVTLLHSRFSAKTRLRLDVLDHLLGVLLFASLTYGAWLHFWSSWVINEPMFAALMTLPWWLGKLALPAGMFLMAAQHALEGAGVFKSGHEV